MKYIDSSVFIGAFLPTDPNHKVCHDFIEGVVLNRVPVAISVFGLAEIGGFYTRNIDEKIGLKHVVAIQKMEHLQIYYAEGFDIFMDSVLAVSVSTGLPAADSIHFISAMSIPDVDEIVTLDRHFKRVMNQIKVNILGKGDQNA